MSLSCMKYIEISINACNTHTTRLFLAVFVNADGKTGFGTPWEIMFNDNYTIRTKGGNVPGYSALFSYIPELKLSMKIIIIFLQVIITALIGNYCVLSLVCACVHACIQVLMHFSLAV